MTSEDWKTVLLALIAMLGTVLTPLTLYAISQLRSMKAALNGQTNQFLNEAHAKGFEMGKQAAISPLLDIVGNHPAIPPEVAIVAKAASKVVLLQPEGTKTL